MEYFSLLKAVNRRSMKLGTRDVFPISFDLDFFFFTALVKMRLRTFLRRRIKTWVTFNPRSLNIIRVLMTIKPSGEDGDANIFDSRYSVDRTRTFGFFSLV